MTCIATDGKVMAADGNTLNANDVLMGTRSVKIMRLKDGSLLGSAGTPGDRHALAAFLNGEGEWPEKAGPFSAIVLRPDGTAGYYSEKQGQNPVDLDLPCAVGSGGELALGAMLAGATPLRAVEIAAMRDPFSGGELTMVPLKEQD